MRSHRLNRLDRDPVVGHSQGSRPVADRTAVVGPGGGGSPCTCLPSWSRRRHRQQHCEINVANQVPACASASDEID